MRVEKCRQSGKGWCLGPWNSGLPVAVGHATAGIDEPHVHSTLWEVYLVARGTSLIRVEQESIELVEGDVLALAPGEAHTFLQSSPDYRHFALHVPCASGEHAGPDKMPVSRERLGLDA